jgi:hypothetical protein
VGSLQQVSAEQNVLIERWNGASWSQDAFSTAGLGHAGLWGAAVVPGASSAWAVGNLIHPTNGLPGSSLALMFAGRWNFSTPPAGQEPVLYDVAAISESDAWAVGDALSPNQPFTQHWNGSTWTLVPVAAAPAGYLNGIAAVSPTELWAVGISATGPPEQRHTLVEHYACHLQTPGR